MPNESIWNFWDPCLVYCTKNIIQKLIALSQAQILSFYNTINVHWVWNKNLTILEVYTKANKLDKSS